MRDVMKMIDAFTTCLTSFTRRFESHNNHTQSSRDFTPNASVMWVKNGTHVHALILPMFCDIDCLCDLCYLSSMCWKLVVCLLFALNVFTFFLGEKHILVPTFSGYSHFSPYILFLPFLVPILKNTSCFSPYRYIWNGKNGRDKR